MMTNKEFIAAMIERERTGGAIQFTTTPMRAWTILSMMQLGLRHPEVPASVRPLAEEIARNIQLAIAPKGSPLWELAEKGWDPAFDQKTAAPR